MTTNTSIPPEILAKEKSEIRRDVSHYAKQNNLSVLNLSIDDFFGYTDMFGRPQAILAINAVNSVFEASDNVAYAALHNREGKFIILANNPEETADYLKTNIESLTIPKHEPDMVTVKQKYNGREVTLNPQKIQAQVEIKYESIDQAVEIILE